MSERLRMRSLSPILFFAVVLSIVDGTTSLAVAEPCRDAVPVELDSSSSFAGQGAFEVRWFTLFAPEPGRLILDVAPLTLSPVEPRIDFLGRACRRGESDSVRGRRYLTSVVVSIDRPGDYFFRVAAQDPSAPLGEYVIFTRLAETTADKEIEEPEEDPDLVTTRCSIGVLAAKEIEEPEEDPDLVGGARRETPAWCRDGESDDEGDVFSCAAPLDDGRGLAGALDGREAIDRDVFTFFLPDVRTFEIKAVAERALFASLYDRQGHRLAMGDTSGGELRIAGTLGPGRYFLRLTGADAAPSFYGLLFETLDW